jgi:hypothetical protein
MCNTVNPLSRRADTALAAAKPPWASCAGESSGIAIEQTI